ncbi:MAG: Stk1 family PASTA domain-containing Ser/Thr kinase [Clostridia bacterium]
MSDPSCGLVLNKRYELLERVGEGGMAVVYRARDGLLGRTVAVKVLREQFAGDSEFVARFRLEARAAASLSHPNVVNIFDVGEDGGLHFIVMEFVKGRNLKDVIRAQGPLPGGKAARIALQIAKALDAAHRQQLVHRDIKPHNILITGEDEVKVTDFGIAQAASAASLTQTGTVIGSVHYFSPEQARGDTVDSASDLYSLGVVLYEMVTGRLPFSGENPVAVAIKHLSEPPVPPRQLQPGVDPRLERIVLKMLEKKKEDRYLSAEQLIRDLREVAETAGAGLEGKSAGDGFADQATQVIAAVDEDEKTLIRRPREDGPPMTKRQKRPKGRGRKLLVLSILFISFFAGVIWAAQILPDLIFPEVVRVPDIVGLEPAEAKSLLDAVGLRLSPEVTDVYSRDVAAGRIVRQDPEANHMVRMGREVKITVSRGPEYVVVPDVVGLPKIEAQLLITQQKLVMGEIREEYNPNLPPNTVIAQDPPAQARLEAGSAVDIVVARGSQPQQTVTTPDVRGLPLEEAQARLETAGLVRGQLHPEPHPTAREGDVIDQNPRPGEVVEVGYPYSLAYAVAQSEGPEAAAPAEVEDKNWEKSIFINVPEGPPQEVVILVTDDWGTRVVYREVARGGSRFNHTVKLRGDTARIQVWFDGVPQMDDELSRPGAGGGR